MKKLNLTKDLLILDENAHIKYSIQGFQLIF